MRVVMDTNVLVFGLLTPFGLCGRVTNLLISGGITLCVDARILIEYEEVLERSRFKFDPAAVATLLAFVEGTAEFHSAQPLRETLPDPDDNPFLEVAVSVGCVLLVAGNLKHYPESLRCGVKVLSPRELVGAH